MTFCPILAISGIPGQNMPPVTANPIPEIKPKIRPKGSRNVDIFVTGGRGTFSFPKTKFAATKLDKAVSRLETSRIEGKRYFIMEIMAVMVSVISEGLICNRSIIP